MNQSSAQDQVESFGEFWPYYVRQHSHPLNRTLHFIGSTLGLVCLILAFATGNLWFILPGFILGYAFAWIGHFFLERNKPATFKYPFWSLRADWKMWMLILTGRMAAEVRQTTRRN
jgi:hypothetical protein